MSRRMDAPLDGYTVLTEHTVVERFPLKIAAIEAYEDRLVVGTSDGSLVVLEGNLTGSPEASENARPKTHKSVKARSLPLCATRLCQSRA